MIGWIRRNSEGSVRAFCAVEHADPATLDDFSEFGTVELVEADHITLNRLLPENSRVLMTYRPDPK